MTAWPLLELLEKCLAARATLLDPEHESAFRLFNGFTEGFPDLTIDLYASTAVLTNFADPPESRTAEIGAAQHFLLTRLPWLRAGVLKIRNSRSAGERRGSLLFGDRPDSKVREHGVWYAIDILMHRDAGLYLDTRNLRRWALDHLKGRTVLNTFAYTGSLGVAALAGGAARAFQLDRNQAFLDIARASCALNGLAVHEADFIRSDFFQGAGSLKRQGALFDCVFLDPPLFSTSSKGVVDQVHDSARLINKARPLVAHAGFLVVINNAVYVSGQEFLQTLEDLCADGYLEILEIIPVPDDFAGYPETRLGAPITDPTPFNQSTKIAVLRVTRKAP